MLRRYAPASGNLKKFRNLPYIATKQPYPSRMETQSRRKVFFPDASLEVSTQKPTLSNIRKWAVNTWKKSFGVSVYEMGGHSFLFEFPNMNMAEHIIHGDWTWKQSKVLLEWWSPTAGCCTKRGSSTWIRAMRLPLHLWTGKIFKAVGDQCGGWQETEEKLCISAEKQGSSFSIASDCYVANSEKWIFFGERRRKLHLLLLPSLLERKLDL